jgi:hypothetical protein
MTAYALDRLLETLRRERPLVHNITNYVVMNFTANTLLAMGASPVMAHAVDEVEEMVSLARALVINIGTLSRPWIEAMRKAGKKANALGVPVILDPVGSGATSLRTETFKMLTGLLNLSVVRGNASEILSIASDSVKTRGVDAAHDVDQCRGGYYRTGGPDHRWGEGGALPQRPSPSGLRDRNRLCGDRDYRGLCRGYPGSPGGRCSGPCLLRPRRRTGRGEGEFSGVLHGGTDRCPL